MRLAYKYPNGVEVHGSFPSEPDSEFIEVLGRVATQAMEMAHGEMPRMSLPQGVDQTSGESREARSGAQATSLPLGVELAFCPTGPGGGIDNSCSSVHVLKSNIGGTTGAKLVELNGQKFVQKTRHVGNEFAANQMYKAFGNNAGAPDSQILDGTLLNPFVEGGTLLNKLKGSAREAANEQIRQNFVVDAWLANWDVIGTGSDNILVDPAGQVHRVDNGGALLYRAQGAAKGKAFGDTVSEIDTLRSSSKNADAARVFSKITDAQISTQVSRLSSRFSERRLSSILKQSGMPKKDQVVIYDKLVTRLEDLKERFVPPPGVEFAFCPTGPGGGINPHCSPDGTLASINDKIAEHFLKREDARKKIAELKKINPKDPSLAQLRKQRLKANKAIHDLQKQKVALGGKATIKTYQKTKFNDTGFSQVSKLPPEQAQHIYESAVKTPTVDGAAAQTVFDAKGRVVDSCCIDDTIKTGQEHTDYAQKHLNSFISQISPEERTAIRGYSGNGYIKINSNLRSGKAPGQSAKKIDSILRKAPPIAQAMVVARGVGEAKGMFDKLQTGDVFQDKGFVSTSTRGAMMGGHNKITIRVPIGAKGVFMDHVLSSHSSEHEFLLPRGSQFRVTGAKYHAPKAGAMTGWKEIQVDYLLPQPVAASLSYPEGIEFSCGANAPGGGGFQSGNTCAVGDGSVAALVKARDKIVKAIKKAKLAGKPFNDLKKQRRDLNAQINAGAATGSGGQKVVKGADAKLIVDERGVVEKSCCVDPNVEPTPEDFKAAKEAQRAYVNQGGLTDKQYDKLLHYAGNGYKSINKNLRHDHVQKQALEIEEIINNAPPIGKEITVTRGFRGNFASKLKTGDSFQDKAFVSTSFKRGVAKEFADTFKDRRSDDKVIVNIRVPKGVKGLLLSSAGMMHEQEFLLQRGTKFRVEGVKTKVSVDKSLFGLKGNQTVRTIQVVAYQGK